jgi:hypothetical protein
MSRKTASIPTVFRFGSAMQVSSLASALGARRRAAYGADYCAFKTKGHASIPAADRASTRDQQIARGKNLVRGVALCADCHSPRLPNGEPDLTRRPNGAPIGFSRSSKCPECPSRRRSQVPPGRTDDDAVADMERCGRLPSDTDISGVRCASVVHSGGDRSIQNAPE